MTIELCIDARMALSSGIGMFIRQLAVRLNRPPFRLHLLVDQVGRAWCRGISQDLFTAPIYSLREQIAYPLKIPSCDLFWSPHYNVPLLPIRAKKRIATIHDACHIALSQDLTFLQRFYAKMVMHYALHRSDRVTTVSTFSKNELIRYFGAPRSSIRVIPNGVDKAQFYEIQSESIRHRLQVKYGLKDRFALYVGNQKPHKNLLALIQGFEQLGSAWEGQLVLVGKIDPHYAKQNRILVLGEVPDEDLPALYSMAEAFVFPSLYEGFGLPPLEAMHCGCPVIAARAASLPEVCAEACLYIDPKNSSAIAQALIRLRSNPHLKADLVRKGRMQAKAFDWDQTALEYGKLFEEVYFEKRPRP